MDSDIKIYDPTSFPFGPLSNNYEQEITINGKVWKTPTSYILSNLLSTPLYKEIIRNFTQSSKKQVNVNERVKIIIKNIESSKGIELSNIEKEKIRKQIINETSFSNMNINEVYTYLEEQEYKDIVKSSFEKAYNSKISQYEDLQNLLLQTDSRPILYKSKNLYLGVDESNNGYNLVGKILMQIRHNIRISKNSKVKLNQDKILNEKIIQAYKAMKILEKELKNFNDLSEYIGQEANQIILQYESSTTDNIQISDSTKDYVLYMYKTGKFPILEEEINFPGSLVNNIRKDMLEILAGKIKDKKDDIIFETFIFFVIKEHYSNLEDNEIMSNVVYFNNYFSRKNHTQFKVLKDTIIKYFYKNKFGTEITNTIKEKISKFPVINQSDIEEAKNGKALIKINSNSESESSAESEAEEENEIMQNLKDDNRDYLIKKIQEYSGKSYDYYGEKNIEELRLILSSYNSGKKAKNGEWIVIAKLKNLKKYELAKIKGKKPTTSDVKKLVKKYNKEHRHNKISVTQVSIIWNTYKNDDIVEEENEDKKIKTDSFINLGKPVFIIPFSNDEFSVLSPVLVKSITIDNIVYPSVSVYNTVMLIKNNGFSSSNGSIVRGMSMKEARTKVINNGVFYDIDTCVGIYEKIKSETVKNIKINSAQIILRKKFEDSSIRNLLYLTGKSKLIWNDPDPVLGGIDNGSNVVGDILMSIRSTITDNLEYVKDDNIVNYLINDPFFSRWLKMRVYDMCNTVSKLKVYLKNIANQDEDIDYKFVEHVINLFYNPCCIDIISDEKNKIKMPDSFVDIISNCKNLPDKLAQNYDAQILQMNKDLRQYNEMFWKKRNLTTEKPEEITLETFIEKIDNFTFKKPTPTQTQIDKYVNELVEKFNTTSVPKEYFFEEKLNDEWKQGMDYINQSILSRKEKLKAIKKYLEEEEPKIKKYKENKEKLLKLKRKKLKFLRQLNASKFSKKEKQDFIKELSEKQDNQRREFYGWNPKEKTKEELDTRLEYIKTVKNNINNIMRAKKENLNHIEITMIDISNVYWNSIANMINVVASLLEEKTTKNIKQIIIYAERLNSQKLICDPLLNTKDPYDNCIASAIYNILKGLHKFKYQYAEYVPFDKYDIDLAVSIILNEQSKVLVEEEPMVEEMEENIEEELDEEIINDLENDEMELDYGSEEMSENGSFSFPKLGMKKLGGENEIESLLLNISPNVDKKCIKYFEDSIAYIKNNPLNEQIKRNRINFFASLKNN